MRRPQTARHSCTRAWTAVRRSSACSQSEARSWTLRTPAVAPPSTSRSALLLRLQLVVDADAAAQPLVGPVGPAGLRRQSTPQLSPCCAEPQLLPIPAEGSYGDVDRTQKELR